MKPPDMRPPRSPAGFKQIGATRNDVTVSWDPSLDNQDVVGYDIYLSGLRIATTLAPPYTVAGLSCGTNYEVSVAAFDSAGNPSEPASLVVTTLTCPAPETGSDHEPPSTPQAIVQTNATSTSFLVSWTPSTDNIGVAGFSVFRDGVKVASTAGTDLALAGLRCATVYSVGVEAYDGVGNTSARTSVLMSTAGCLPDTTPPSVPQNQSISAQTQTSFVMSWSASTDDVGVTGYNVYLDGVRVATTTSLSFTYQALVCGRAYVVALEARDGAGNVSEKRYATGPASTLPCASDETPPTVPASVRAVSAGATSLTIAWEASSDNVGVSGYGLYSNATRVATTDATSYMFTGLQCGRSYMLSVDAYDNAENRSARATIESATSPCPDSQPPSIPTGLAQTARSETSITLTWNASTDNISVVGYGIYQGGVRVATTASTAFSLGGLACGETHTLGLDAYDAAANRSAQASVVVSTSACQPHDGDNQPPSVPQGMRFSGKSQTSVSLVWNASTDDVGVAGYHLYRNGVRVTSSQSLSHVFTGLTCGTSYTFGLEAYDAAGNVSNRAEATGTTSTDPCNAPLPDTEAPSAPSGLTFPAKTQTSVSLAWNAAADNVGVAGYHVYRGSVRIASTQSLGYTFAGLTCGTNYIFSAEAYDAAGNTSNRTDATTATHPCGSPSPPSPTGANLWIDPNGGTCTRSETPTAYIDAAACATFDLAYDAANTSQSASTVLIKGGAYPAQTITGDRSATDEDAFEPNPGETMVVKGLLTVAGADRITFKNLETAAFGKAMGESSDEVRREDDGWNDVGQPSRT